MAQMTFEVPHRLSKADAQKRTADLTQYWATKYGMKVSWSGDVASVDGKVMGISLSGRLFVEDHRVRGEATDPGFLFRERAKKYIHGKFETYLDPNQTHIVED